MNAHSIAVINRIVGLNDLKHMKSKAYECNCAIVMGTMPIQNMNEMCVRKQLSQR